MFSVDSLATKMQSGLFKTSQSIKFQKEEGGLMWLISKLDHHCFGLLRNPYHMLLEMYSQGFSYPFCFL